jgi:membrane protein
LAQVARWVILAAVIAGSLAVLYRVGPNRDDAEFSWTSPGAITATVLWLVGSAAFSFYVSNFGSYNETYGSIAGVIVLMLWLFLSAFIVLLGAEINSEIEHQTAHDTTVGEPEPMGQRGAEAADTVKARTTDGEGTRH